MTEKEFTFRFRGKESFQFMQTFPEMILMIFEDNSINSAAKYRLIQIHCQSILIRQLLSYSVRITNFNSCYLVEMKSVGITLFKLSCLFDNRISPSLWTLCDVAPVHASICFSQYNMGLGCNTMEGREQKHQLISKYAENTAFQNRWSLIFRHEYIQLIHLRENGFDKVNHIKRAKPFVPILADGCVKCSMKLLSNKTEYGLCDTEYPKKVYKSISKYKAIT